MQIGVHPDQCAFTKMIANIVKCYHTMSAGDDHDSAVAAPFLPRNLIGVETIVQSQGFSLKRNALVSSCGTKTKTNINLVPKAG